MKARWLRGVALGVVFVVLGASIALADTVVVNDLTTGGDVTTAPGATGSAQVTLQTTNGTPSGDTNGCNATGNDELTVNLTSSDTDVVTLDSPGSVELGGCGAPASLGYTVASDAPNLAFAVISISSVSGGRTDGTRLYNTVSSFTVTVEAEDPGDVDAPTNASISIDDGAAWTTDAEGDVAVDLAADDNVGVASYKLAENAAGLATATAVAVTPAEADFDRTDVAFALTGSEGSSKAVWLEVCDAAGNCATASDTIGWDKTAPSVGLARTAGHADTGTGWTKNSSVSVDLTASDNISLASITCTDSLDGATPAAITFSPALTAGSLSYSGTLTVTGEGVHALSCTAADAAGNSGGPATHTVRIDTTAPVITITSPADGATYTLNADVYADYSCSDGTGSGVVSGSCVGDEADGDPIDTSTVGPHTFSVSAEDIAGNQANVTHDYNVHYGFVGFDRPVDNGGVLNVVKAGQGVPLKFRVVDADGTGITGLTAPPVTVKVSSLNCDLSTSTDLLEEVAAGSSGLQDLGGGYYTFVWKTPKEYANSCKTLSLNLGDGNTTHTALFKFTR